MDTLGLQSFFGKNNGTPTNVPVSRGMAATTKQQPSDTAKLFFKDVLSSRQTRIHEAQRQPSTNNTGKSELRFIDSLWRSEGTVASKNSATAMQFVQKLLVPATQAAHRLGTQAAAVISVAALETGWGQHVVEMPSGASSNNLFGIKSTDINRLNTTEALTTEYQNGAPVTLREPFRTYDTTTDSVADFADFILSNPRYQQALKQAADPRAFIDQIHQAGYATDPEYAVKVKSVLLTVEQILDNPMSLPFDHVLPFPKSR